MKSVLRAFEVLNVPSEVNGPGSSEAAARMDVPESAAHLYPGTLEETRYVVNEDGQ